MPKATDVLADPTASFWLKDALKSALDRDAVDACNDAQVLADVLKERVEGLLRSTNEGAGPSAEAQRDDE